MFKTAFWNPVSNVAQTSILRPFSLSSQETALRYCEYAVRVVLTSTNNII